MVMDVAAAEAATQRGPELGEQLNTLNYEIRVQ